MHGLRGWAEGLGDRRSWYLPRGRRRGAGATDLAGGEARVTRIRGGGRCGGAGGEVRRGQRSAARYGRGVTGRRGKGQRGEALGRRRRGPGGGRRDTWHLLVGCGRRRMLSGAGRTRPVHGGAVFLGLGVERSESLDGEGLFIHRRS